ncbi:MAG TPA: TA system VapC family ribonuclease toxin, partial [Pirellulales bacterium]|nr:TA system VapC family ribonuclease toxin [Pirellulales bacterium]
VNLWLALAFDAHVHHSSALGWFESSSETSYFCRLTQQGFLRLATNPKVLNEDAVSLKEAWLMYDQILADPLVAYAEEPADIEDKWRAYTQRESFTPNVWSDAYLAAFAQAAGFELVTLDHDFKRYQQTRFRIL